MYNFTMQFRSDSKKCLYEQIYEHIRQEIRDGKLLMGEKLPSTRSLAEFLQVSRSTVDVAYDQLLSEGYIESRPYRGYFVCAWDETFYGTKDREKSDSQEHTLTSSHAEEKGEEKEENRQERFRYDFSPNGIEMSGFPFSVWKSISRNVMTEGNRELFERGEAQGDFALRETIGKYLYSSRGVRCRPEQILIGAGNDYLLMLLDRIFGRKLGIAMEDPTYPRAYRLFRAFGYRIYHVDMDEKGMSVYRLSETRADCAYVMPSHQYPMGMVMPVARRLELLRWANEEEERYIIEDDYDSEFRYRGKPIPSLQSADKNGKVVYIGTFSKAIAPAIRIGYLVLPENLLERYRKNCFFYSCTVSRIDQRILNEFIANGHFERHLNRMRKIYRAKHDLLLECLKPLQGEYELSGDDAGLHVLLTSREGRKDRELMKRAEEEGVKIYALSSEDPDREGGDTEAGQSSTIMVGFGGLSQQEIVEGCERLVRALKRENG